MTAAGLILAGGEGRRWGGPKAWARLPDGRTFLEACARSLEEGGAAPVAATLPPGAGGPVPAGVVAVPLPAPGLDMMASVRHGLGWLLERVGWERVILLPVDHPLVAPSTVAALAAAEAAAAIATWNGRHGHPLALSREVAERVADGRSPGPTLREVLREAGAVDVAVDDPGIRANCNTPEALREALERLATG